MSHLRKITADLGKSQIQQDQVDKVLVGLILVGWLSLLIGMWWVSKQ